MWARWMVDVELDREAGGGGGLRESGGRVQGGAQGSGGAARGSLDGSWKWRVGWGLQQADPSPHYLSGEPGGGAAEN